MPRMGVPSDPKGGRSGAATRALLERGDGLGAAAQRVRVEHLWNAHGAQAQQCTEGRCTVWGVHCAWRCRPPAGGRS